ncbi:MAG: autotransporter outer membrane beta-barrel domain-containing protein [Gammaproteobacteria bacterium]
MKSTVFYFFHNQEAGFTDNFLMGVAFGYNNATSAYNRNLGKLKADSYRGAIYGLLYTEGGFFVDGIVSSSQNNYTSNRKIQYRLPSEATLNRTPNRIINTNHEPSTYNNFSFVTHCINCLYAYDLSSWQKNYDGTTKRKLFSDRRWHIPALTPLVAQFRNTRCTYSAPRI